MKILDIGGGFNGCETQLELVSTLIFKVDISPNIFPDVLIHTFNTAAV